jgi:hypothetical protein
VRGRGSVVVWVAAVVVGAWGSAAGAATDALPQSGRIGALRHHSAPLGPFSLYGHPVLAATAAPSPRHANATFQDTVGDAEGGLAPDLASVAVVDDPSGTIGFGIDYANRVCAAPGDFVAVFVDTDRNPDTGSYGADAALAIDASANTVGAFRWDGAAYQPFYAPTLSASCDTANGFNAIFVSRTDLGVTTGFAFDVSSQFEQEGSRYYDQAPDSGTWSYELAPSTEPPAPPACADGIDNDGDAAVDYPADPGCADGLDDDEADTVAPPPPGKTYRSAPALPRRAVFTGALSIKHEALTSIVHRTMRSLGTPRTLAVACWAEADWDSVLASLGVAEEADTILLGFWLAGQPRWLHLSPGTCTNVQRLISTKQPNAPRARAFTTVLHETLHAYRIRSEAMANCYAAQLVPYGGRTLGLSIAKARSLGRLAVVETRLDAPPGYWNRGKCRDGGTWDLLPDEPNLR